MASECRIPHAFDAGVQVRRQFPLLRESIILRWRLAAEWLGTINTPSIHDALGSLRLPRTGSYASSRSSGSPPDQQHTDPKDVPVRATRQCQTKLVAGLPRRRTVQKLVFGYQSSQATQRRPASSMCSRSNSIFSPHVQHERPNRIRPECTTKRLTPETFEKRAERSST